jgi:2-(1,2-epoxy-1,2-dihydrophenyl)acetyl-CoA isomerase
MAYETILHETRDGYAAITLNRPDKLNAYNRIMLGELNTAVDAIAAGTDGVRALLITGAGRGFCAGADLADRAPLPKGEKYDLRVNLGTWYNPLIRKLRALRVPVIIAVNGVAAGAGMSLAMAGDITLAARSAKFIQSFARIGLVPDAGSTYHLPRLVGIARARALAMLAEPLPAEQAEAWGLIWKCVDDEKLMLEANALASRLATAPTEGLALIKQAFNASLANDLSTQLDLERDLQYIAGHTYDFEEGVRAFLEKRDPNYRGR